MESLRVRLALESLDGRIVPTTTQFRTYFGNPAAPQTAYTFTPVLSLPHGDRGTGTFAPAGATTGGGEKFALDGRASLAGFGAFHVSGSVHEMGDVRHGHARGHIVLANRFGSINLAVVGTRQKHGPRDLPHLFNYTVVGGTGEYAKMTGQGAARIVLTGGTGPGTDATSGGTFSIKFL